MILWTRNVIDSSASWPSLQRGSLEWQDQTCQKSPRCSHSYLSASLLESWVDCKQTYWSWTCQCPSPWSCHWCRTHLRPFPRGFSDFCILFARKWNDWLIIRVRLALATNDQKLRVLMCRWGGRARPEQRRGLLAGWRYFYVEMWQRGRSMICSSSPYCPQDLNPTIVPPAEGLIIRIYHQGHL